MIPYREIPASPRLRRYVECYWEQSQAEAADHLVLPDGCVDILFSRSGREPIGLTAVGLMTAPMRVPGAPARSFFGVRFRPGMASAFLPGAELLINDIRPLDDLADSSLDQVISDSGLSVRHFRRLCLERAGVSPKYLSRILRFRKAVQKLPAAAQPSWADFAAACGYYDQAHFIREFQEFAGCTPGRFLQSRGRNLV